MVADAAWQRPNEPGLREGAVRRSHSCNKDLGGATSPVSPSPDNSTNICSPTASACRLVAVIPWRHSTYPEASSRKSPGIRGRRRLPLGAWAQIEVTCRTLDNVSGIERLTLADHGHPFSNSVAPAARATSSTAWYGACLKRGGATSSRHGGQVHSSVMRAGTSAL